MHATWEPAHLGKHLYTPPKGLKISECSHDNSSDGNEHIAHLATKPETWRADLFEYRHAGWPLLPALPARKI